MAHKDNGMRWHQSFMGRLRMRVATTAMGTKAVIQAVSRGGQQYNGGSGKGDNFC